VLSLEDAGHDLLLRVADETPDLPIARRSAPQDEGGRGLMLVEALSDCWGVDASESGKSVWVTFAGTFG
jgi:hypothetical protein